MMIYRYLVPISSPTLSNSSSVDMFRARFLPSEEFWRGAKSSKSLTKLLPNIRLLKHSYEKYAIDLRVVELSTSVLILLYLMSKFKKILIIFILIYS